MQERRDAEGVFGSRAQERNGYPLQERKGAMGIPFKSARAQWVSPSRAQGRKEGPLQERNGIAQSQESGSIALFRH
jgi:hypothetical protein